MNYKILKVDEPTVFDSSIRYAEKHTHNPNSTSFDNCDEIRIPIQQQDIYTFPQLSSLHIIGKALATPLDSDKETKPVDLKFVNNGLLLLFEEIRLEIGGVVIDRVRNPGLTSIMKGYGTFNANESIALQSGGWFPKETSTIIDKNGCFSGEIPLRMCLGFCEDFRKILMNTRQELILLRSNTDVNAVKCDRSANIKISIDKIFWKIPHISVSDVERLKLLDTLERGKELDISFRSREYHEYPLLPQSKHHNWSIKTSIERPLWIFLGLQEDRKNKITKDYSHFDHCNITNVKVYLNDAIYPYDNLNIDFDSNRFDVLYGMYTDFQTAFLEKAYSEPIFSPQEFKTIAPIAIINCSKQNESIKRSPTDIRIEFECKENIPAETSACCTILYDREVKYNPYLSVVKLV